MDDYDRLIDAALNSEPMLELPPDFVARVMAGIQPRPRYTPEFLDLAIPAFGGFFCLLTLGILGVAIAYIKPEEWYLWDAAWLRLTALPDNLWLAPVALLGLGFALFLAGGALWLWMEQTPLHLERH